MEAVLSLQVWAKTEELAKSIKKASFFIVSFFGNKSKRISVDFQLIGQITNV